MTEKKLKIVTWPAKVLESEALPVTDFDTDLRSLSDAMYVAMKEARGIGLAANQVGILKRLLIIEIPWHGERYKQTNEEKRPWHDKRYNVVNPEIVEREGKISFEEGCLSFPDIFGEVERSRRILVKTQDVDGKTQEIEADGLFSVCLQHEIDHLNGIVFINHLSRLRSSMIKKEMRKRQEGESFFTGKADNG